MYEEITQELSRIGFTIEIGNIGLARLDIPGGSRWMEVYSMPVPEIYIGVRVGTRYKSVFDKNVLEQPSFVWYENKCWNFRPSTLHSKILTFSKKAQLIQSIRKYYNEFWQFDPSVK